MKELILKGKEKLREYLSEEMFMWMQVESFQWGTESTDYNFMRRILKDGWTKEEQIELKEFVSNKKKKLKGVLNAFNKNYYPGKNIYHVGDDGFWDLISHIVGLGHKKFYEVMNDPMIASRMGEKRDFAENFEYVFNDV